MGYGSCAWNNISSCRFAQFNAVAVHRFAVRVRADSSVLASQMGVALDLSSRIKLARSGTRYQQLGALLGRSLRRVLWAGSHHAGHAGWARLAQRLKLVPAHAGRSLKRQTESLASGQMRGRSGQPVKNPITLIT